jgi:hypothetical protein
VAQTRRRWYALQAIPRARGRLPAWLYHVKQATLPALDDFADRAQLRVGGGLELYLKQCFEGAVDPGKSEV